MILSLPQHDPAPDVRHAAIQEAQKVWMYGCWEKLHSFAKKTPFREFPRLPWVCKILPAVVQIAANDFLYWVSTRFGTSLSSHPSTALPASLTPSRRLRGVPEANSSSANRGVLAWSTRQSQLVGYRVLDVLMSRTLGRNSGHTAPSTPIPDGCRPKRPRPGVTLEDFKRIYRAIPIPPLADAWTESVSSLSDEEFGWLRLAGPNPEMLTRVDFVPEGFEATARYGDGPSLAELADSRSLFLADYKPLAQLENTTWDDIPRYVCPPRALFRACETGVLPLAIQCLPGGKVFGPSDPGWTLAKHVVQVADGNYHELISHLGRTHLLVELFLMATRRNLAPNHPLYRLLVPHFEGTVFINDQARNGLIAPGGAIDQIFAGTIESSQKLAISSLTSLDISNYDLPTRTRRRGVDEAVLPEYPWRDDALEVWSAIESFVQAYLGLFYKDDSCLSNDRELQNWSTVLSASSSEGGVAGFQRPTELNQLVRLATLVIYTASAQHAAVNFPQYPIMSFSPLVAGSGWAPGPDTTPLSSELEFYPPRQLALKQASTLFLLSSVHHTQLGHYETGWFGDLEVDRLVDIFQRRLQQIESIIHQRNRTRRSPYTHLLPSLIPQSINI